MEVPRPGMATPSGTSGTPAWSRCGAASPMVRWSQRWPISSRGGCSTSVCGEGADAVRLARQGWDVTALDVSQVALERAARHAREADAPVRWVPAGLMEAQVPAGVFDLVSAQYPARRDGRDHGDHPGDGGGLGDPRRCPRMFQRRGTDDHLGGQAEHRAHPQRDHDGRDDQRHESVRHADGGEDQQPERGDGQPTGDDVGRPDPRHDLRGELRGDDERDGRGQRPQPGDQRREADHELEVLGDEQEVADHHEDRQEVDGERGVEGADAEQWTSIMGSVSRRWRRTHSTPTTTPPPKASSGPGAKPRSALAPVRPRTDRRQSRACSSPAHREGTGSGCRFWLPRSPTRRNGAWSCGSTWSTTTARP